MLREHPERSLLAVKSKLFQELMSDRGISDVTLVGHGSLSHVVLDDERFNWFDMARTTEHLKMGRFTARTCGGQFTDLNVPLGWPIMSRASDVIAAAGHNFRPKSINDSANELLQPVTTQDDLTYEDVKRLFPKQQEYTGLTEWHPDARIVYNAGQAILRNSSNQLRTLGEES